MISVPQIVPVNPSPPPSNHSGRSCPFPYPCPSPTPQAEPHPALILGLKVVEELRVPPVVPLHTPDAIQTQLGHLLTAGSAEVQRVGCVNCEATVWGHALACSCTSSSCSCGRTKGWAHPQTCHMCRGGLDVSPPLDYSHCDLNQGQVADALCRVQGILHELADRRVQALARLLGAIVRCEA